MKVISIDQNKDYIELLKDIDQKLDNLTNFDTANLKNNSKVGLLKKIELGAAKFIIFNDATTKAYATFIAAYPHLKPFASQLFKVIIKCFGLDP